MRLVCATSVVLPRIPRMRKNSDDLGTQKIDGGAGSIRVRSLSEPFSPSLLFSRTGSNPHQIRHSLPKPRDYFIDFDMEWQQRA
ncbi:hypothetical protein AVEN_197545-1 [Araneus ventricosus]|uniref:Uncharacterized protein n=1 Tax=Araneus ventricosus TaxID=182803 RepID=A0A4Y2BRN0_ARAVE|nr:hypothetical protein AVEN_197545-1 [Araneus ventricosus]